MNTESNQTIALPLDQSTSGYRIRLACAEDITLLAAIERAASVLFENTPYSFLVSAEPLPLEFVQQRFQAGHVWVAVDRDDTVVGYAIAND